MPVASPPHLYDLGTEILDAAVLALQDSGLDVPNRTFVAPGAIADDFWGECDGQLAVRLGRIYSGLPGLEVFDAEKVGYARTASFFIRITRCVRSLDGRGNAPSAAELGADARMLYSDAWVLQQNMIEAYYVDKTFLSKCQRVVIGNLIPVGPQGGVGGWEFNIDVQIHGV